MPLQLVRWQPPPGQPSNPPRWHAWPSAERRPGHRSASARRRGRPPTTRARVSREPSRSCSARANQPRTGAIRAVSKSRCIATRTPAPAAAISYRPVDTRRGHAPTPRSQHRDRRPRRRPRRATLALPGQQAVGLCLHEEVECLLPVFPGCRVTRALDQAKTNGIAHRTPLPAERNREGYRRNSLAHAPRTGTTSPRSIRREAPRRRPRRSIECPSST